MGGGCKEYNLIDLIRNGESQQALKILFKNKPKPDQIYANKIKRGQDASNPKSSNTLKNKINVNFQDSTGKSIIHEACINGSIEILKLLIEFGAKLDTVDKRGFRPFHYACQNGRTEIVSILIRHGVSLVEPTLYTQETPLHLAMQHTNSSNTAKSINNEAEAIALLILSNGGHFCLGVTNKTHRMTPFELGCELGKTKLIKIILKYCSENFINNMPTTIDTTVSPLRTSFSAQHTSLLEFITKYSPNAIHLAAKNGHNDIIRLLLIFNVADINRVSDKFQGTALHEACRYGRLQTVKLLLECGININSVNDLNQTASDVIIKQKVENDIKCLIKEFSQAVYAVSTQPYLKSSHSGALNFDSNELIVVLERPPPNNTTSGNSCSEIYSSLGANIYGSVVTTLWRGFILNRTNFMTRSGYFPASFVNIIDINDVNGLRNSLKEKKLSPDSSEIYSQGSIYSHTDSINVVELIRQGLNDSQIIFNWLGVFNLQQYYQNFVQAGYDLLTIFKTTPADLSAIGIYDPSHRQLIKQNMSKLNIGELEEKFGVLLAGVESIEELLRLVHLEQYFRPINDQRLFKNLTDFANTLSWEDLEEIGVQKLGHQKKLMLVAKRLKEIKSQVITKDNNSKQQSLDNLNDQSCPRNKLEKPVPPKRNIQETSQLAVNKKAPPTLPPRKSSVISSNYSALPNNTHQTRPINEKNLQISANFGNNKEYSASTSPSSSQVSSGTISPSSTSSSSASNNGFDSNTNSTIDPQQFNAVHLNHMYNNSAMISDQMVTPRRVVNFNNQPINRNDNNVHQQQQQQYLHFYNSMSRSSERNNEDLKRYTMGKANSRSFLSQNISNSKNPLIHNNQQRQNTQHQPEEEYVLSDIDNMLCDLNKQLDDMLVGDQRDLK